MGTSVLLLALVATTSGHTPAGPWRSDSLPAADGAAADDDSRSDDDLLRPEGLVIAGDLVNFEDAMGSGDLANGGEPPSPIEAAGPRGYPASPGDPGRTKRKVISRGGHYIVWSRSGTSPWSSAGYEAVGDYRINNNREYGWSSRGRIGDGGGVRKFQAQPEVDRSDRRASRKKLNKSFKREIAQYAMVYGTHKAAVHYEETIGRRLRDRVVQKFVQRYQERRKRKRRRRRRRGHS